MTPSAPRSVAEYLESLRIELQGADPALIQDALYDAEEHLRAELAQSVESDESRVLETIINSYGSPDEVADAYRANEVRVQAALQTPRPRPRQSALGRFFGVYRDPHSYLALLYLLLAMFTGVFYFTFAVTGISLSIGLAVLIIGIPFFILFIGTARVLALAEGRLVESMLGTRMPRRPPYPDSQTPWPKRVLEMLKDSRTWGTLLYFVLMLPLGIFYFVFAVAGVVTSFAIFLAPLLLLAYHFGLVEIDGIVHTPHVLLLPLISLLGLVLLTLTMHLARGLGYLHGQLAKSLLVRPARKD